MRVATSSVGVIEAGSSGGSDCRGRWDLFLLIVNLIIRILRGVNMSSMGCVWSSGSARILDALWTIGHGGTVSAGRASLYLHRGASDHRTSGHR